MSDDLNNTEAIGVMIPIGVMILIALAIIVLVVTL